jgi:predicted GNAT family acetyltransferase
MSHPTHRSNRRAVEYGRPVSDTTVRDNPAEHRYELVVAGRVAGFAAYLDRPGGEGGGQRRVFTHTEIDDNHEGHGLGTALVKGALADVRASGRRAVPVCPFVAAYVKRHPEEADIVDRATPAILTSL